MSTDGPGASARCTDECGFTLIELLVVMMLMAILASLTIPSLLNQVAKAHDADAKHDAMIAATALETWAMDNGGYAGAQVDDLTAIEPTLNGTKLQLHKLSADHYEVRAFSYDNSSFFTVIRTADGGRELTCRPKGAGGCHEDGTW